jgi:hypothetical protein
MGGVWSRIGVPVREIHTMGLLKQLYIVIVLLIA